MQLPDSVEEWNRIAAEFYHMWNFPNCIGAIDGKLVHIQRPVRCGATYFNYKRSFSVNMMAVIDARYRFLYVAVGAQGSANDAAVFNASRFAEKIADSSNPLCIPAARPIPGTGHQTPLLFVADDAYPLRPYIMKPFSSRGLCASERIFNYRLSRARRVVENSFGILVNRFRIFRTTIQMQPEKVTGIVLAACALHNYLRSRSLQADDDDTEVRCDDNNVEAQHNLTIAHVSHQPRAKGCHYNAHAKSIRDTLAAHFVSQGQVYWQWKYANVSCDTTAD